MTVSTNTLVAMTEANQNFSKVAKVAEKNGQAVIFKNNKPKYLVIDMENEDFILDLTEEERIDIITKRVLDKYLPAFKELAK